MKKLKLEVISAIIYLTGGEINGDNNIPNSDISLQHIPNVDDVIDN